MNKYQCQVCGAVSYSAASQENLKDNSCLECDGRVEMVDGDKMNADEIVKKIRSANICDIAIARMEAADLIESLQAQHKQDALNYQQKCRDVVELEAQLAKYDALAALREQAERSKGCGFCCYQEHPDKTFYPKEGYAFYAGFSKQIDVDAFDEIETDEIKYCPMCGRELGKRLEVET